MGSALIAIINLIVTAFTILILVYVVLSYFLSPYHPIREMVGRIMEPLLNPIRRLVPPAGGFDFSPMILWIAIEFIGQIMVRILRSL